MCEMVKRSFTYNSIVEALETFGIEPPKDCHVGLTLLEMAIPELLDNFAKVEKHDDGKVTVMEMHADECMNCGQGFLIPMGLICPDCDKAMAEKLEAEQVEAFRADLFDETTNDLPPYFPWGKMNNQGFTAHRL